MNRFHNHCLLRAGSLRLVITYFDPLGVGLLLGFLTVLFLILGSKGGGDFAVEGGKLGFEGFQSLFLIIASYRSKCSASTLLTNDLIEHGESFS